jgi:hypothetical protein
MEKSEFMKKYLAGSGDRCPFCGSRQLTGGVFSVSNCRADQGITCQGCHSMWTDHYKLVDVEIVHNSQGDYHD